MAVLDTLITIFTADTSDLKRGYTDARKSTDDIVRGMRDAEDQAQKTRVAVGTLFKGALGWLASVAGVSRTFGAAIAHAEDIQTLQRASDTMGVAIDKLDAYRLAIRDNGGDAAAAVGQLQVMYRQAGSAANDSASAQAKAFAAIGVSVSDADGKMRDALDVMLDVSDAMQGMDRAKAIDIAARIGITDNATLDTMLRGRKEMEAMMRAQREQGIITKESAERALAFNSAMDALSGGITRSKQALVDALLPALTWVTDRLGEAVKWFNANKHFVVGFFAAVSAAVLTFFAPSMYAAAVAAFAAISPFLLIGAAVGVAAVAIGLLVDDIAAFMRGSDSMVGKIAEQYPAIGRAVAAMADVVMVAWGVISGVLKAWATMLGALLSFVGSAARGFALVLLGGINAMLEFRERLVEVVTGAASSIIEVFARMWGYVSGIIDKVRSGIGAVAGVLGKAIGWADGKDGKDGVDASVAAAREHLTTIEAEPLNAATSQSIRNSSVTTTETNVQVGEITIQTQATDAKGIARDTRSELSDQLRSINAESASAVVR